MKKMHALRSFDTLIPPRSRARGTPRGRSAFSGPPSSCTTEVVTKLRAVHWSDVGLLNAPFDSDADLWTSMFVVDATRMAGRWKVGEDREGGDGDGRADVFNV